MGYWSYAPYVSVAERRKKAEKAAAKASKGGAPMAPVAPYRGAIAKTFWGKAWCDNLERYSDYENRLPRGRSYVRNGSVIDLQLTGGEVRAQVMGSSLYQVGVAVQAVQAKQWQAIGADCAGSIDSLVELLQGRLSGPVMERICKPAVGLFPEPKELSFKCSCPDSASMCKHIAAVLYGVGARLDLQPELLFLLRKVDAKDLVAQAGATMPKTKKAPRPGKLLDAASLAGVFGLDMAEDAVSAKAVAAGKKPGAARSGKAAARTSPAAAKGDMVKVKGKAVAKAKAKVKPKTLADPAAKPVRKSTGKPVSSATPKANAKTPARTKVARSGKTAKTAQRA